MTTSYTSSNAVLIPSSPIVNMGNLYLSGMVLAYATTTTFTVGVGQCRDSTDTADIIMGGSLVDGSSNPAGSLGTNNPVTASAAVTVTITASGAGGLDAGTIAANTLYYVHAIGDSRGFNNGSALISLSATAPSLPLGYDCFRRVGAVATLAGAATLTNFEQTGAGTLKTMWYDDDGTNSKVLDAGTATGGYTTIGVARTLAKLVPALALEVILNVSWTPATANDYVSFKPYGGTNAFAQLSGVADGKIQIAQLACPCSLHTGAPEIDYDNSAAAGATTVLIAGYRDQL